MHKWHLVLFAFLAVFKPTVSFGEHSLADGQQQCCDRHSSFLLRDTTRFLHGSNRYIKSVDEDHRINLKALRDIRQYDHEPGEHSVAQITAKDKHVNPISLQLNGRNIRQPFKNTRGKWNYEIARESIFGVYGSRQNQNQGTRLAVHYSRDNHRTHSSNPQEVRDVTHYFLQGARNDAARPNRNVQRTVEYRLNGLRSVKRSESKFDTNCESRVDSRMSRDVRETAETRDQGARNGIGQSYGKLKFMVKNKLHGMRRDKRSEPRFNTNREHQANSRISRDVRGATETRDQVTGDDVARPYRNVQRTVEYRLDRLRRVARSEPRLYTIRESRVNSRISQVIGESTEIRDQRTRNDVVRSYRKAQLNVENRLNSFRSDTSFESRLNTNREHRVNFRTAQDVRETAETRDHEARKVVRSYRNVPLMVENRKAGVIRVTRSEPRLDIKRNHSLLKYSQEATEAKETRDLLQARNVIIRSHRNVPRTIRSTLNGLRRVSRSETRLEDNRERRIRTVGVLENESEHPIITRSRTRNVRETAFYHANTQHHNSFRTEVREKRQEDRKQTFFERRVQRLSPTALKIDNRIISRYESENLWKLSNEGIDEQRYQRDENTIRARQELSRTIENRRSIRSPVILRNSLRVISRHRRNQRINQIQYNRDEISNQPILLKPTQNIVYQRSVLLGFKYNRVQNDRRVGSGNIRAETSRIQERSSQESERNDDTERSYDGRMKFSANVYGRSSLSEGPNRVRYPIERSANIHSGSRQQNNVRIYGNRQFSNNGRVQRFRNVRSITDDERHSLLVNRKSNQLATNNERFHHRELTNRNVIVQNDLDRWDVRNYLRNDAVNNGHGIKGYTERRFETRGLVRDEMNRPTQRSRESTSSYYRHYIRKTVMQERGVQVRYTLPKANDVKIVNDHTLEIKEQKEPSKEETKITNWHYIFYTIQGLYVCAVIIQILAEDKLRKIKKGYLGLWKFSQDTLKVE